MQSLQELKSVSQLSRKREKKHDKTVLLAKTKLNTVKVLISKALIDSYINQDEFILVNNMLREYNEVKEEIKNPEMWNILCKNNGNISCQ